MAKLYCIIALLVLGICIPSIPVLAQTYCQPTYNYNTPGGAEYIQNFAVHTLQQLHTGRGNNGYVSYVGSGPATVLAIGQRYPVTITAGNLAGLTSDFAVWIDFNSDFNFDSSERVFLEMNSQYSTSGLLTIPNDTSITGTKRLRVMSAVQATALSPCGTYSAGETEDYEVIIARNVPDTVTYCLPTLSSIPNSYNSYILDTFRLQNINNSGSGIPAGGYTLYDTGQFSTSLSVGHSYPVYFSSRIHAGPTGNFMIWIDLDNDRDFSAAEQLLQSPAYGYDYHGILNIPYNHAYVGFRRMRVRSGAGTSGLPCSMAGSGETEDYTVELLGSDPAAISILQKESSVSLYPNPASQWLYLQVANTHKGPFNISICNSQGHVVLPEMKIMSSKEPISVEALPAGMYWMRVQTTEGIVWLKWMRQ